MRTGMMTRNLLPLCIFLQALGTSACTMSPLQTAQVPLGNPSFVPGHELEPIWERTVDVLHDYRFEIARENKLDGIIETKYKVGSGIAEPWHRDSVGLENRLESSLQSIRRKVFVTITKTEGGFLVGVQAHKELEDLAGLAANSAGGATFQENTPLQRDLNLVVGQTAPSGWISKGRDVILEQDLITHLSAALLR